MAVKTTLLSALLVFGLYLPGTAVAEIYKWVDENGKVHFSDRKPTAHKSKKINVRTNTYQSVSFATSIFDTGRKVVMYSTSWCGYCKKARQYFRKNGIPYTEYDIESNPGARSEYETMGATGVPVILVGKKRMNGFSEAGFKSIYN